jgi:hypothetical protein
VIATQEEAIVMNRNWLSSGLDSYPGNELEIATNKIYVNYPKVCNKPRALNRYKKRMNWRLTTVEEFRGEGA